MASVEFLKARIEGKEKEIAKLQSKMERILKAQASDWQNNPYYYNENDLKWTTKDLESAKVALDDYRQKLQSEVEKAGSRNVPAILEFLAQWKERVTASYRLSFATYAVELTEWHAYDHRYTEWSNYQAWKMRKENPEEVERRHKEHRQRRNDFHQKWNFITPYVDSKWDMEEGTRSYFFNEEKFQKDLNRDADAKYDFIIERTNAIVGTITDASNLKVGAKGDLNGYIIGTKGTAKVQTIGAGGYNIQCFHFRTLINKA